MPIVVKNLMHTYAKNGPFEKNALNNISFSIEDGEFVALIGHTGSGKSTLIQHLNGLLKPDSGSIEIDGVDITQKGVKLSAVREKVGIVFQYPEYQLFEETVYKDIAFGPSNLGLDKEEIDRRVRSVAEAVGLAEKHLTRSPFELSGGQKRRVAIAGVLAMEPKVLILDEPTAGLDPVGRDEILNRICALHRDRGITVILVSHSMEDVARVAQRVMVMADGELKLFDTVDKVFRHADLLTSIGLNVPQVSRIVEALRASGMDLSPDIYTVERAAEEILRYRKEAGLC
ncbi:MAG: energy-coupling factor transporter ATPase [Ruminococcaceae bacterium]|nr:energy-coupling factor transporter ATPase [Oscillospiraceae bacterium]